MTDINKEVERIERGDAWDETDVVVHVDVKKPLDKVIPIRLPSDKWEQIREEARELGVGPSTLARMWILEHLRQRVESVNQACTGTSEPFWCALLPFQANVQLST